jgi:predicted nucleic acid-binding Zn ribbon protein
MRDRRGRSRPPRPVGEAIERALAVSAPQTILASVQSAWPSVAGPQIAAVTSVVSERDGEVTIECESSVWAQELEMMAPRLLSKLTAELSGPAPVLLRFRASG